MVHGLVAATRGESTVKRSPVQLMALALWAGISAGCAVEPVPVKNAILDSPRYLRYTLRTEPAGFFSRAYRSNYLSFPAAFKAGSAVDIPFYSASEIRLNFNGIECRMYPRDLPFPTDDDGLQQFVDKHFAGAREELNLEALEPTMLSDVAAGRPNLNMSKEQVFLALGYPSHIDNWTLADGLTRETIFTSNTWIYRYNEIMWISSWWIYKFNNDNKFVQRIPP